MSSRGVTSMKIGILKQQCISRSSQAGYGGTEARKVCEAEIITAKNLPVLFVFVLVAAGIEGILAIGVFVSIFSWTHARQRPDWTRIHHTVLVYH